MMEIKFITLKLYHRAKLVFWVSKCIFW